MTVKNIGSNQTEVRTSKCTILVSYSTPVAANVDGKGYIRTSTKYSNTTNRHISQWLGGMVAKEVPQEELDALLEG